MVAKHGADAHEVLSGPAHGDDAVTQVGLGAHVVEPVVFGPQPQSRDKVDPAGFRRGLLLIAKTGVGLYVGIDRAADIGFPLLLDQCWQRDDGRRDLLLHSESLFREHPLVCSVFGEELSRGHEDGDDRH